MRAALLPWKNLARRRLRNGLAALGIALATATYLAMSAIFGGLTTNWQASLDVGGVHALVLQERQVDWLASSVPEDLAAALSSLPEVADATPELLAFLSTSDGVPLLITGWPAAAAVWRYAAPDRPEPPPPGGAYIGESAAEALGLSVEDRLSLDGFDVSIAALLETSDPFAGGRVLVRMEELQEAMFRQRTATLIRLRLADPGDDGAPSIIRSAVSQIAPGLAVRPTAELSRDNRILRLLEVLHIAVVWTVALAAAAGVANTMLMAITERRAEIGLYRAIGWRPWRILVLFLAEAGIISFMGGLVGIALGSLIVQIVGANASLASFIAGGIDAHLAVLALGLAVVLGLLGAALPVVHAIRVSPDAALRSY